MNADDLLDLAICVGITRGESIALYYADHQSLLAVLSDRSRACWCDDCEWASLWVAGKLQDLPC